MVKPDNAMKRNLFVLILIFFICRPGLAQQYEVAVQSGHTKTLGQYSAVTAIRYSSDGKYLVTGGNSGNAILWEIATGRQVRSFGNSPKGIQILDLTDDNQHLFIQPSYDVPLLVNTVAIGDVASF
jgi:WD40 repeat protein